MNLINRTIYYYQVSWLNNENNQIMKDKSFFDSLFKPICIKEDSEDFAICLFEYTKFSDKDWTFGILSKTKKTDFPLKHNLITGDRVTLGLNDNEGLYHPTHFAIFKGKILLVEFNHEGLRPNSFLKKKINNYLKNNPIAEVKSIEIKPIIRQDLKKILLNSKLRDIQISIAPGKMDVLKEDNNLSSMFNNIENFPDLTLNIGFSMGKRRSAKFYEELDKLKKSAINLLSTNKLDSLEKFIIKRKTDDKIETINLLDQIFKTDEEFLKSDDKTKAINSYEAFKSFKLIYRKHKVELDNMMIMDDFND